MPGFQFYFELIGAVAFAISGAALAVKKHMDLFGVAIMGMTTAVGGGILRDLLLGITPPAALRDPLQALVAIATSLLVFLVWKRFHPEGDHRNWEALLLVADSIGLGIFSVHGAAVAIRAGLGGNVFLTLLVGMLTGVGGGVLRDLCCMERPYIFTKHIYACPSPGGGEQHRYYTTPPPQSQAILHRNKCSKKQLVTHGDMWYTMLSRIYSFSRRRGGVIMGLHDGHRQRSKRRYLALGAEGLEDHQLLELLLFYAIPRQDTNETAHRLIQRFGSLQGVLHAAPEELTSVEGVGENAAVLVRLVGDMALRARCSSLPQKVLNSPDRTGAYFMELLAGEKKEMLYQVCLDAKGKLLTCRCISKGSVAASPVSVRQVVENALYAGASSIILAHNHPSGVALPSQQDLLVTRQIQEALSPLNIRLADHVVVADSDYVSMAESGLLAR